MTNTINKISIRSPRELTVRRLRALSRYDGRSQGALLNDAIDLLWDSYRSAGHVVPKRFLAGPNR